MNYVLYELTKGQLGTAPDAVQGGLGPEIEEPEAAEAAEVADNEADMMARLAALRS